MRAGIYVRISRDRDGTSLGVKRQEKLCREILARVGWTLVDVYQDNDVSATKRNRKRPDYERMLRDVRADKLDAIVALDTDRLLRRPLEFEQLAEIGEPLGLRIEYQSARVDFQTGEGVMEARIRAAVDAEEVAKLQKRVRRKARERAEAGEISGGGTRPFGFHDHDKETDLCRCCLPGVPSRQFGVTLREDEAAEIRLAVRRILDNGWSFHAVTRNWNDRGVLPPNGKAWRLPSVKRMLLSPRIAGLRQHETKDGRSRSCVDTFPAIWPAIISEEDHELLKKRGERAPHRKPAKYLLRGLLFTAEGEPMVARPRADQARAYYAPGYRCLAEPLEAFVADLMLTELEESPKVLKRLTEQRDRPKDAKAFRDLQDERERLDRIHELYEEGAYSRARYESKRDESQRKIAEMEDRLGSDSTAPVMLPRSGPELRAWWERASFDDRRRLLSLVFRRVVLKHPVVGRNFFDPNRVDPEWRL